MEHIKWDYGVKGILDDKEKQLCEDMDAICIGIIEKGKDISVVISIEGGNQFHIKDGKGSLVSYMTAEQCKYALKGIFAAISYM